MLLCCTTWLAMTPWPLYAPGLGSLAFPLPSSTTSRVLLSTITSIDIASTVGAVLLTHPSWLWNLASLVWWIAKVFQLAGVLRQLWILPEDLTLLMAPECYASDLNLTSKPFSAIFFLLLSAALDSTTLLASQEVTDLSSLCLIPPTLWLN